jgi:excisionase family DNA binding protein
VAQDKRRPGIAMPKNAQELQQTRPPHTQILSLDHIFSLFIELRDMAYKLVELHLQLIDLLQKQISSAAIYDLKCLSVTQTAEILSFDIRTIYRLISEGELEAVGSGHRLRVLRSSIQRYIERHRKQ